MKTEYNKTSDDKRVEIVFVNQSDSGGMSSFWFNAFFDNQNNPYFSIGINGKMSSVTGRYNQQFTVENAKDLVAFLSDKINEMEKQIKT